MGQEEGQEAGHEAAPESGEAGAHPLGDEAGLEQPSSRGGAQSKMLKLTSERACL